MFRFDNKNGKVKNIALIVANCLLLSLLTAVIPGCNSAKKSVNNDNLCSIATEKSSIRSNTSDVTISNALSVNNISTGGASIADRKSSSLQLVSRSRGSSQVLSSHTVDDLDDSLFQALSFPDGTVKTLEEADITEGSFKNRASGGAGYTSVNCGINSPGIVVSPYFTAKANNMDLPVYASVVHIGSTDKGAIQSYSMVDVESNDFSISVELSTTLFTIQNAMIRPASLHITPSVRDGKVSATITKTGIYTFLVNNGCQECAYTLFVRKYVNEEEEIQRYINEYGADKVKVYDKGLHFINYINIPSDNYVLYLRKGALLVANHCYEIKSDSANNSTCELNATSLTGVGLNRFPIINCNNHTNVKIVGRGTIDMTRLDWHERRGVFCTFSSNVEISGITIINNPEWSMMTYRCKNINIHDIAIFGYKTNSDGINICNSQNVCVTDCFARSGDDLFSTKTLGGESSAICSNVIFNNCIGWAGKARCFGITGEVNLPIKDITYKNCSIIYRDATWDNNRLGGLVVVVETGTGSVSNVTFENIEIYYDEGRPININVYNPDINHCNISNIVFRNVTYRSGLDSKFSTNNNTTNRISAEFNNVNGNGEKITSSNYQKFLTIDSQSSLVIR